MATYDLELERVIAKVKEKGYTKVMIQLPDGLKTRAKDIVDAIREETGAFVAIYPATCFGACDTPEGVDKLGIDLFVQWGHNRFNRVEGWGNV